MTRRDRLTPDGCPEVSPGNYNRWFALAPETILEAAEYLADCDDGYAKYLAVELIRAYDETPADLTGWRDADLEVLIDDGE